MATCRGCLSNVCAVCDLSPSMCQLTECGRFLFVRTAGLHCRFCFTTIDDADHDHTSDEESDYETSSETDEGFCEEEEYYVPEVQPRIVSFSIYYYFFYFFFKKMFCSYNQFIYFIACVDLHEHATISGGC